MKFSKQKSVKGFTLIEGLITIAMVSILASIAAPSFNGILKQNRLAAEANTITASINYARNETINQNSDVLIQPITAGTDWSAGWQVSVGGTVLRSFEGMENSTLTSSVATITYQPDGSVGANITLTLTPYDCPTGKDYERNITISPSGKAGVTRVNCP